MEAAARMRLAALAVLLAVLVPLVVIAVSSGGGDDGAPAGLLVERTPGVPEVIVYVEDPEVNHTDTAGGAVRVTIAMARWCGARASRGPSPTPTGARSTRTCTLRWRRPWSTASRAVA
jgi:hypothetical protein